jgi:signal peptide peptidase SppA
MHSILLQVFRGNWYIEPSFAQGAGFLIQSMLNGRVTFEGDREKFKPSFQSSNNSSSNLSASQKQVAVISIAGALMKNDQECGPAGMDSIGQWIKEFDINDSVSAIVLKFDTPGGTVSGTAILGEIIKNCRKPIVAFIDEMACSAGYWLASQCDWINASTPRAQVGSIGVMLSFADMQPMWEKEGVAFHEIYSDHSSDKNKDFREIRSGKYENYVKDVLNPLAEDFIAAVKSSRKISDESIFKGRVVFADKAVTLGLIDGIDSFDATVQLAIDFANDYEKSINETSQFITEQIIDDINKSTLNSTNPKIDMTKFKRIAALAKVESFESTEEGIHVQEETLEAIENSLNLAEEQRIQNELLTEAAKAHQQEIEERDARIAELQAEVDGVRSAAGATTAIITAKTDPDGKDADALNSFCSDNEEDTPACVEQIRKERPNLKIRF